MGNSHRSFCPEANPPNGTNLKLWKCLGIWMPIFLCAWLCIQHSARKWMGTFNGRVLVPVKEVHSLRPDSGFHKVAERATKPTVHCVGAHNGHVMVVFVLEIIFFIVYNFFWFFQLVSNKFI